MFSSLRTTNRVVQTRYGLLPHRIASANVARPTTLRVRRYAIVAELDKPPLPEPQDERTNAPDCSDVCASITSESQAERTNEIGVQQLPMHVRNQLFSSEVPKAPPDLVELAKKHLKKHDLLGKANEIAPPISFDLPPLQGKTLDEHFFKLGINASEPYLTYAKQFAEADLPKMPEEWVIQSGWTKYVNGEPEKVDAPEENMLVFDVEVLYKVSPFAIMACAASPNAWYAWLSPWLLGESDSMRNLVPLGNPNTERIVVGHNIGYDRARIAEEYNIKQTKNSFLDTMSLHVAVNGMCSQQRPTWIKHAKTKQLRERLISEIETPELADLLQQGQFGEEEEEPWLGRSSINNLRDVAKFHCNVDVDKSIRDDFGALNSEGIMERLHELLTYCAADVDISHKVYKAVLPRFLTVCPHPVSFGAMRHLSSVMLPVNREWENYIKRAEKTYQKLLKGVFDALKDLAQTAVELRSKPEVYNSDEWLRQLDWSGQEIRMTKETKKNPSRPVARQKLPGMPKWYKDLFPTVKEPMEMNISVRTRVAPLLLRMAWKGNPLIWSGIHGWTFRVKSSKAKEYEGTPAVKVSMREEENFALRDDTEYVYFKLPHKDGTHARCSAPLAKGYLQYFEDGILTSEYPLAVRALKMNAQCSYWISARERIRNQMVIYDSDVDLGIPDPEKEFGPGIILPQIIPMGTITRRAVERTWLTASNAKKNRVGSELKAMVKAPPGYVFVGADVDSEELWIASLVGDAQFKLHGGNALGFMTLEGSKAQGTDLHSKTASILGISRNNAKVFNYGRIYGAGLKFAVTLLRQFNPGISDADATKTAENLYRETKGIKTARTKLFSRQFWRGGTESMVFNKLEEFAEQDSPRTPVLGAGITEALMRQYISKGGFLTSRINWAIQSSGVDYLHLLIISMDYLIRRYSLDARVAITVHDEIRYLVKEEHKYKVALALQVANIWTRAMFSQQMGIEDLPQSCAWFSAVDIDNVFRKEVDMDCITPSQLTAIPPGECVDIQTLLAKGDKATLSESACVEIDLSKINYTQRTPIMESLAGEESRERMIWQLRAQIANDEELKLVDEEVQAAWNRTKAKERMSNPSSTRGALSPLQHPRSARNSKWEYGGLNNYSSSLSQKKTQPRFATSLKPRDSQAPRNQVKGETQSIWPQMGGMSPRKNLAKKGEAAGGNLWPKDLWV